MNVIKRRIIAVTILAIILILSVTFFLSPYSTALLKSKSDFIIHPSNYNVLYEPGADHYADSIISYLPAAIKRVEKLHGLPFENELKVYVCNTQKSLNEFIAQPDPMKIRGAVVLGDVFISPNAFHWKGEDTHRGLLIHELSHLHFYQKLGYWNIRTSIPVWFKEGLANVICNCTGEGIGEEMTINSLKTGYRFTPDNSGSIFNLKNSYDYGLDPAMFHSQTRMFVTHLNNTRKENFNEFLLDIQMGDSFEVSFKKRFRGSVVQLWNSFIQQLN